MKVLDLFSGIGGFSLGLEKAGMETVAFCEIDRFCKKVLTKHWPETPVFEDIRSLNVTELKKYGIESVDVICGGFPCQPFSLAGRKKGTADNRDLWPEMFRLIRELKPRWVIGENVAHFANMALERSALDLESEGYEVQAFIIPACSLGAPHKRERVWIVAHANCDDDRRGGNSGFLQGKATKAKGQTRKKDRERMRPGSSNGDKVEVVTNPNRAGLQKKGAKQQTTGFEQYRGLGEFMAYSHGTGWEEQLSSKISGGKRFNPWRITEEGKNWPVEPTVCRMDDGIPNRLDRIKSLGNSIVPQIVELIGRCIVQVSD